jgi:hypothetical protein
MSELRDINNKKEGFESFRDSLLFSPVPARLKIKPALGYKWEMCETCNIGPIVLASNTCSCKCNLSNLDVKIIFFDPSFLIFHTCRHFLSCGLCRPIQLLQACLLGPRA